MASQPANDVAWDKLLSSPSLNIEDFIDTNGFCDVTADQIKQLGDREPRLACKHDYRAQVPKPLSCRKISVLAISNGQYRLARTDPFFGFQDNDVRIQPQSVVQLPDSFEFINTNCLSSESKALDAAFVSGILNDVFEEDTLDLVVRGRERSREFEFSLVDSTTSASNHVNYPVKGVQFEVDGGYEGTRGLHLVEAKIWSAQKSMNIRQLLYPYLHYSPQARRKEVSSNLMFFDPSTCVYRFYKFNLDELVPSPILSPTSVKEYRLVGIPSNIQFNSLRHTDVSPNWSACEYPFPQADSFSKILHLFKQLITDEQVARDELFASLDITPRQYNYYGSALCWLGLAERRLQKYCMTPFGKTISTMPTLEQLFHIAKVVYSNDVFNAFLNGGIGQAQQKLRSYVSGDTVKRRLSTVKAWSRYFSSAFEPFESE